MNRLVVALLVAGAVTMGLLAAIVFVRAHAAPVPVAEQDAPRVEGGAITFSAAYRERAGIRGATVERGQLVPVIRVVGTTTFDPENVSAVGSRVRGFVRRVYKVEGDSVEKGDVLAEIESAELGAAQSEIRVMKAHQHAAALNAKRERDLATKSLTTAREVELAEATLEERSAQLSEAQQRAKAYGGELSRGHGIYALRAPMRGTIVERRLAAGQSVEDHHVAFRVADLDHLWVELEVFERELSLVHEGDSLDLFPLSDPGAKIAGRVAHVGAVVDATKKSADVRVEVDNQARRLRSGQSVTAVVRGKGAAREALMVPKDALTYVDGRAVVFVLEGDLRARSRVVTAGFDDGGRIAIDGGLAVGESVVAAGVFALKSELYR